MTWIGLNKNKSEIQLDAVLGGDGDGWQHQHVEYDYDQLSRNSKLFLKHSWPRADLRHARKWNVVLMAWYRGG